MDTKKKTAIPSQKELFTKALDLLMLTCVLPRLQCSQISRVEDLRVLAVFVLPCQYQIIRVARHPQGKETFYFSIWTSVDGSKQLPGVV